MLKKSVVIIPIYRPDDKFKKLLAMLKQQKRFLLMCISSILVRAWKIT